MTSHPLSLTPGARAKAHAWLDRALSAWEPGKPWTMVIKEPNRSDDQNAALHGLISQIMKQRKTHNGVRMDMALWKATFMQALGEEVRFSPTLDGNDIFPIGLRTSTLSVERFSELIELILAWCAREGLTIEHFDGMPEAAANENASPRRAA